jgi:ABC-type branched-subunit amino acid transport system ATPase component
VVVPERVPPGGEIGVNGRVHELDVRGITKRFGGLTAVDDVSLSVRPGAITAVIGPNGAGKTTLFNIINGFERPDAGVISVRGVPVRKATPLKMAGFGMARTFQTPVGFPTLSIWENLIVGGGAGASESLTSAFRGPRSWKPHLADSDERAEQVMRHLDLWELRDARLEELSPGVSKLVEFARQLMVEPSMLLLDEPAAGVDPQSLGRLAELISELAARDIGILIIDHNLEFILRIADFVYVLAEGAVISEGEPQAVANDQRVIETYLGTPA